jgi:hypothetical protein
MYRCPACTQGVSGVAPFRCMHCGAALEFVPWRHILTLAIPMGGTFFVLQRAPWHIMVRIAVSVAVLTALTVLCWSRLMRLRIKRR